jgi:hypothetical protein
MTDQRKKRVSKIDAPQNPVTYPYTMLEALKEAIRITNFWVTMLEADSEQDANKYMRRARGFAKSFAVFDWVMPEMTEALKGMRIRYAKAFMNKRWHVCMIVEENPIKSFEEALEILKEPRKLH